MSRAFEIWSAPAWSSYLAAFSPQLSVFSSLQVWLDQQQTRWPVGSQYEFGGEYEASVEGNQSIGEKLPIAGLIILLLLVGQFNSLRRPAIILMTIPLGLIGVVFGLLVADSYFGFITLLGVISLAGIVINNAIVLLDRVNIDQTNADTLPFKNFSGLVGF